MATPKTNGTAAAAKGKASVDLGALADAWADTQFDPGLVDADEDPAVAAEEYVGLLARAAEAPPGVSASAWRAAIVDAVASRIESRREGPAGAMIKADGLTTGRHRGRHDVARPPRGHEFGGLLNLATGERTLVGVFPTPKKTDLSEEDRALIFAVMDRLAWSSDPPEIVETLDERAAQSKREDAFREQRLARSRAARCDALTIEQRRALSAVYEAFVGRPFVSLASATTPAERQALYAQEDEHHMLRRLAQLLRGRAAVQVADRVLEARGTPDLAPHWIARTGAEIVARLLGPLGSFLSGSLPPVLATPAIRKRLAAAIDVTPVNLGGAGGPNKGRPAEVVAREIVAAVLNPERARPAIERREKRRRKRAR